MKKKNEKLTEMQPDEFLAKVSKEAGIEGVQSNIGTVSTVDEALAKILDKMADNNPETRKMMSDLSPEQVRLLSILYTQSKEFACPIIKDFADHFVQLRHSKNRLSRGEIVKLSGNIREQEMRRHWASRLNIFNRGQGSMGM